MSNHFVFQSVKVCMGWSPEIESRLRGIGMMIPEIRTIIADSDLSAREQLRFLLSSEAGIEIVAECSDVLQTVDAVRTHKPDLLMLDMQMQDADGFQILNSIPSENMPIVIFTSVNDQHAIKAFEVRALDYLLKPLDPERFYTAIGRTRAELLKTSDRHLTHRILDLLADTRPETQIDWRLLVKANGRVLILEMDEIDWIEAAGNYVKVKVGSESYLLREGIGRIAQRLDARQFVRIHRSMIVNVRRIKELQPCNSGEYMVVLKDGKELSCSRGYRANLQQTIAAS
jgi:two-component system LytT family response regulator